jgi:hypothetical protein
MSEAIKIQGIPNEETELRLQYQKRESIVGVVDYTFPDAMITFVLHDIEKRGVPEFIFAQRVGRRYYTERVGKEHSCDMSYVDRCLRIAAGDAGYTTVWFRPDDADAKPAETDKKRDENIQRVRRARVALFKKYWNVEESPDGEGYLIKL